MDPSLALAQRSDAPGGAVSLPEDNRVALTLSPAAPVKGRDESALLEIRILRPDNSVDVDAAPPVLVANVGTIEAATSTAPGVFRARYLLPVTRYPEVAVLVAFSAWPHPQSVQGAFGQLRVPLASAIELPGRTEPGAQMSIELAGVSYGPVQAERDGRFRLPVVAPPGHRYGKGTAVDRIGNRRSSKIDLMLPPTDQLACVMNPRRLPADGTARARVLCALSDPYGKSVSNAKATLKAKRGVVAGPRTVAEGVLEWIYTAPKGEPGADTLESAWKEAGPLSRDEIPVDCVQGPAAKVELRSAEAVVNAGSSVDVRVAVTDALGRLRPGPTLVIENGDGSSVSTEEVGAAREESPGKFVFRYSAPPSADFGAVKLKVRAVTPTGSEPASLSAWRDGARVRVEVTDLAGWPVPRQPLNIGARTLETGADGAALVEPAPDGKLEVRHARWPGLALSVRSVAELPEPKRAQAFITLNTAPAAPVNLRAEVSGREVTYWVEDASGRPLPGREVAVMTSGPAFTPPKMRDGKQSVRIAGNARASVSLADRETGVTALVEVAP
ncbi:MAG: hypothetical protein ACT4TC_17855 [Myxococcaceae bacterium]